MVELNLRAPFLVCKAVVPVMERQGAGRIVVVSSGAGRSVGLAGKVLPYTAAKAGVLGLTRQLAEFLAPLGVTVNAVAPGAIATPATEGRWQARTEEFRRDVLGRVPMGRRGQPEEVADVIAFLASDDARYMTGQTLHVDGGRWMV